MLVKVMPVPFNVLQLFFPGDLNYCCLAHPPPPSAAEILYHFSFLMVSVFRCGFLGWRNLMTESDFLKSGKMVYV